MAEPTLYNDIYAQPSNVETVNTAGLALFSGIWLIFWVAYMIAIIIAQIKVYTKAGKKWWEALIPFYNIYILLQIVNKPGWWLVLFFIPFANFVVMIILLNELSKAFGHGTGFTLGLILLSPIFWLILGFGDSKYQLEQPSQPVQTETDVKE